MIGGVIKHNKSSVKELFSLEGKVALLTGSSGQLGLKIAEALLDAGAHLLMTDIDIGKSSKWAAEQSNSKQGVYSLEMDVSSKHSVEAAKQECQNRFKRIDIVVNNAGVGVFTPFEDRTDEEFQKVIDVNLKGTFNTIQTFSKIMRDQGSGVFLNIGSHYGIISCDPRIYGDSGRNSSEIYGATKAGIIQMTRYYAVHLAAYGIRVNAISPGGIFNHQKEFFVKNYEYRTPLGRMGSDDDLKGGVVYLVSDASKYVTGHNLIIDGGFSIW